MIDVKSLEQIMRFMAQNRVENLTDREILCWTCKIQKFYQLNEQELNDLGKYMLVKFFQEIKEENARRGLENKLCLGITPDGQLVKGREELRDIFSVLSFDEMLNLIDEIFENNINFYQRSAIIDLAYEKVYEDERKALQ